MAEQKEEEKAEVKKHRIRKEDWTRIERYIKGELDRRQNSEYRSAHERIWREVDRQLRMEPMQRVNERGQALPPSWNSAFELGELSKTSEVIAADVRRIIFPMDRSWFEAHVELAPEVTPQGPRPNAEAQKQSDGLLRSLMVQQHQDFGFKARFDLSIKEALHHGCFVAEILWQQEMMVYEGSQVGLIGSPCWIPHSMWNCYPDESPSVATTSMFYTGSMIIRKFMPRHKLEAMRGAGWMPSQFSKIPKNEHRDGKVETKDVELLLYYGDLNVERSDGEDIYLPNSKAILANGTIVFYAANELPYPNVIYGGYERQDPRDPYFTSPLIKQSPIQKIASILANKFIDGISLKVEPPLVYDGNDPYFVQNDGPVIAPGAKTATKGSTEFKEIQIGEPKWALEGLQMALRQMQEGTGVSAVRTGLPNTDRQTATEVVKVAQGAEVRTIDFIDKLNANLRTFLYMQHELNKRELKRYSFYNSEMGTADFVRVTRKDLPENAHFDIVGAKGVLGEEQRAARTANVVAFASGNPLFAPLLNTTELLLEMFQDAGNKNPERFIRQQQPNAVPPEVAAQMQRMAQAIQALQAELEKAKSGVEVRMRELDLKEGEAAAKLAIDRARFEEEKLQNAKELQLQAGQMRAEYAQAQQEFRLERERIAAEYEAKIIAIQTEFRAKISEIRAETLQKAAELEAEQKALAAKPKGRKMKVRRTKEGYEIED